MRFFILGLYLFVSVLFFQKAQADHFCTLWTKTLGVSCVFNGNYAELWERQCENSCGNFYGPQCDLPAICMNGNPNELKTDCTSWVKEDGFTCRNPNSDRWEQSWIRSCKVGLAAKWCSDKDPNNI
jgi:hypothetical protein